jgi:PTH1 family peptidyl-tRNA hydrolase
VTDLVPPDVTGPWLVVGLGNPGPEYAGNRHNVGAMVLDVLGERLGGSFKRHKARAAVLEGRLGALSGGAPGPRAVLAKPTSYMNESGGPVAGLAQFYSVEPGRLVVVHDELDIPFGDIRLKLGGGEGGHNGLRSVTRSLGTKD